MLFESAIGKQALADENLLLDVVKHKQIFFNASYANYDKCLNKQFQLIPSETELTALERDFNAMLEAKMFYGEEPKFGEVIRRVHELEKTLNTSIVNEN